VRPRFSQFPASFWLAKIWLMLFVLCAVGANCASAQNRGTFVYTGGNGYSGTPTPVSGFAINASNGTLSTVSGSPFGLPGRLLAIAGDPSGKFVYVVTTDGSLSAFTVDSLAGTLTPVSGGPYTISGTSGGYSPTGRILSIDPTGKYLYTAGGSQLYGFAIDASSGALSAIADSPFTATSASAVAVDPSGHYLVTSSGTESWVYTIDSSTGALSAYGSGVSGCGGNRMTFEPSGHFFTARWGRGSRPAVSAAAHCR
jgi:6-phosphogluconolactonase